MPLERVYSALLALATGIVADPAPGLVTVFSPDATFTYVLRDLALSAASPTGISAFQVGCQPAGDPDIDHFTVLLSLVLPLPGSSVNSGDDHWSGRQVLPHGLDLVVLASGPSTSICNLMATGYKLTPAT